MPQPILDSELQKLFDEHCATGVIDKALLVTEEMRDATKAACFHWYCIGSRDRRAEEVPTGKP